MKLSVVSPVYNSAQILEELVRRIKSSLPNEFNSLEIVLVDDGSADDSWDVIKDLIGKHPEINGIKLSRNFGQHNAITAGLQHSTGEWVVVMDCDLQDQPEEITKLFEATKNGYDIVLARRVSRKDNFFKVISSRLFYRLFSYLTETHQDSSVANYGIYSRRVVQSILMMRDSFRVFPILVQWVGFKRTYVNVIHSERFSGKSNYDIPKLLRLAMDMIISFSEKPLRIGLKAGMVISLISFCVGVFYFILYMSGKILVPGFTSIIIFVSFSTGAITTYLGLIGLYLGKVLAQSRNRPYFIVEEMRSR